MCCRLPRWNARRWSCSSFGGTSRSAAAARCELLGRRGERLRERVQLGGLRSREVVAQLVQQPWRLLVELLRRVVVRAQQVVEAVPAGDGEAAPGSQKPRRLGEEAVVVGQVLDQAHRRDGVELACRKTRLVVRRGLPLDREVARVGPRLLDHPRRVVDPDRAPAEVRGVDAELAAAASRGRRGASPPASQARRPRSPGARARSRRGTARRRRRRLRPIRGRAGRSSPSHSPSRGEASIAPVSAVNVIAEVGMTHDGSLGHAIRMAEVAAECGVDAVKFQLHDAEAETTRDAPSPPYFKHETRWEYFERTAFTDDQWATLEGGVRGRRRRVPLLRVLDEGGRASRAHRRRRATRSAPVRSRTSSSSARPPQPASPCS